MPQREHWVVLAMCAALALSACAKVEESAAAKAERFNLELVDEEKGLNRLTLVKNAAERIGVTTEKVGMLARFGGESRRTSVPHGAVLYDPSGETFVYTSPEPLVFIRHPITVDYVEDGVAVLVAGPSVGTPVVTVGVAELFGMEFGVGK
jgi:hypothetical protein